MMKDRYTDAYFYDTDYLTIDIFDEDLDLVIDEYTDKLDKIILEEIH